MPDHTPEPWEVERDGGMLYLVTKSRQVIALLSDDGRAERSGLEGTEADARRIVACVNATAGIPTERLERMPQDWLAKWLYYHETEGLAESAYGGV